MLSGLETVEKSESSTERHHFLSLIRQEGLRMQHLIADMLLLANADAADSYRSTMPPLMICCFVSMKNMKTWLLPRGFPCSFPLGMRLTVTARWIRSASHRFCPFLWTMHCLIPHRGENPAAFVSVRAPHHLCRGRRRIFHSGGRKSAYF